MNEKQVMDTENLTNNIQQYQQKPALIFALKNAFLVSYPRQTSSPKPLEYHMIIQQYAEVHTTLQGQMERKNMAL